MNMGALPTKTTEEQEVSTVPLPVLHKDMTLQELRQYDGTHSDGRILVAVNGNIYDVSSKPNFYGQNAPYAAFAGRDATRGFATFKVEAIDNDDLSDLTEKQITAAKQWEEKFQKKYNLVGKLIKDKD